MGLAERRGSYVELLSGQEKRKTSALRWGRAEEDRGGIKKVTGHWVGGEVRKRKESKRERGRQIRLYKRQSEGLITKGK